MPAAASQEPRGADRSYATSAPRTLLSLVAPAYGPAVFLARQACFSLFARLDQPDAHGVLQIVEYDEASVGAGGDAQPAVLRNVVFGDPVSKRVLLRGNEGGGGKGAADSASASGVNAAALPGDATHAILHVRSGVFWLRLALGNDLGFAESFMLGDVQTPDLGKCFKLFIENREVLSDFRVGIVSKLSSFIQSLLNRRYANTKAGSLRNIGAHYDISNRMYEAFLSRDMTYSCAVFPTLDADHTGPLLASVQSQLKSEQADAAKASGAHHAASGANGHGHGRAHDTGRERGATHALRYEALAASESAARDRDTSTPPRGPQLNGNGTAGVPDGILTPDSSRVRTPLALSDDALEDGQLRKLQIHIERAALSPHHHVLEVGTGWGSLSMEAVRSSGCTVDSLTLSVEQKALAEQRIAQAGLSGRIKVHLMDYRDMPADWTDRFDRVISIEMLEAVGIEFLPVFFANMHRVLKRRGGVCVVQCITMPEERFAAYVQSVDFIKKWIFPGGVLPSVTSLLDAAKAGSDGALILDTVHSIGPHYARTLREWRYRFERHFDERIAPALLDDHKEIRSLPRDEQQRQIQIFRRKWLYYFIYCEVGFTERVIGDHILSFTRSGNKALPVCCG